MRVRFDRFYTYAELTETLEAWAEAFPALLEVSSIGRSYEGREIPLKYRELIALAVGITTQCVYCIDGHSQNAVRAGASEAELAEAAWVATAIRAGGGYAHGRLAFKLADDARVHQH